MSKKKNNNKPTIVNNIESIHMDIDYKKLANSMIETQKELDKQEFESSKIRICLMRICNAVIYSLIYVFSVFYCIKIWPVETGNRSMAIAKGILIVLFAVIAIFMFLSLTESFKDTKKDVQKYFNLNISFIALIVSLIALFKGVDV